MQLVIFKIITSQRKNDRTYRHKFLICSRIQVMHTIFLNILNRICTDYLGEANVSNLHSEQEYTSTGILPPKSTPPLCAESGIEYVEVTEEALTLVIFVELQ